MTALRKPAISAVLLLSGTAATAQQPAVSAQAAPASKPLSTSLGLVEGTDRRGPDGATAGGPAGDAAVPAAVRDAGAVRLE